MFRLNNKRSKFPIKKHEKKIICLFVSFLLLTSGLLIICGTPLGFYICFFISYFLQTARGGKEKVEYSCKFDGCGRVFTSLTSLNRHKRTDGHSKRDINRRNPVKKTQKKKGKKQRFSVSQLINNENSADSSSDDQVDECDASPCVIENDKSKAGMVDWVQCEVCEKWLHTFCIGIEASLEDYICKLCA